MPQNTCVGEYEGVYYIKAYNTATGHLTHAPPTHPQHETLDPCRTIQIKGTVINNKGKNKLGTKLKLTLYGSRASYATYANEPYASNKPNCVLQQDSASAIIKIYTTQAILAQQEITIAYGTAFWQVPANQQPTHIPSPPTFSNPAKPTNDSRDYFQPNRTGQG